MNMIQSIIRRLPLYREQIAYLFFGVLTTLVNYIIYFSLSFGGIYYAVANAIALVCSILFAYVTNKRWVFQSRTVGFRATFQEFATFMGGRAFSAVVDMVTMVVLISLLHSGEIFAKIFTGILVIVLNYIISKCFVFKKKQ